MRGHPTVGVVRGQGLFCCLDLVSDKSTREPFGCGAAASSHPFSQRMAGLMVERGLLTRVFMSLQLAPPLVLTREEIDRIVSIVDESMTISEREFGFA